MRKKSQSEIRRIQELRRSNAATPLRSKKIYSRNTRQNKEKMLELKEERE
jgi:hypothetical protein